MCGILYRLALFSKQAHDSRIDPRVTSEMVIKNGQPFVDKQHLKTNNNINTWTSIVLEVTPHASR